MKRYIFFYALSMLFLTAMNFGMYQTESSLSDRCAINRRFAMQHNIPTYLVDGDSIFMRYDGEVVVLSKQSTDKRVVYELKPGKPLKKIKDENMDVSK